MNRSIPLFAFALGLASLVTGCATNYAWKPSVPQEMRAASVPTFRNESSVSGLGAVATRQVLRELQREGTFKICSADDAAIEIQGVVKSATASVGAYSRATEMSVRSYNFVATAEVSVIDKRLRKVLVDNRKYTAQTAFTAKQDLTTAERDASGRLMEDLARQIVDDLLALNWKKGK